jgi:hypothetical protein
MFNQHNGRCIVRLTQVHGTGYTILLKGITGTYSYVIQPQFWWDWPEHIFVFGVAAPSHRVGTSASPAPQIS